MVEGSDGGGFRVFSVGKCVVGSERRGVGVLHCRYPRFCYPSDRYFTSSLLMCAYIFIYQSQSLDAIIVIFCLVNLANIWHN